MIADLVVNHTSVDHPWFQAARADRRSPYRDFYRWADEPPADGPKDIVFPGRRPPTGSSTSAPASGTCTASTRACRTRTSPTPGVRDEIHKVVGFWLELGLSGFRVDAAPFLIEPTGAEQAEGDPHEYLRDLRAF